MKDCTRCIHAKWHRTSAGRLHPSGDGECQKEIKLPPIPGAFHWLYNSEPRPIGGYINRRTELAKHCPYYQEAPR